MLDLSPTRRRWLTWTLRVAVLVLVVVSVRGTVKTALDQLSQHTWHADPAWLITAGVLYLTGLVAQAWFWQRALAAVGYAVPTMPTVRAYFLGHLGKYVPGKALAVLLRVAAIGRWVPSLRIGFITSLIETLTMMAVGALLAAVLSFFVLKSELRVTLISAALAIGFSVPLLPPIARRLAAIGEKRAAAENDQASPTRIEGINWRLTVVGFCASTCCWILLALSLWAMLRAIGVETRPLYDLPLLITTVALAVVAGFASMLPGGIGVRDLLLTQLLAPVCGPANALVAAVLMRLVWLVSEVAACVILYLAAKFG